MKAEDVLKIESELISDRVEQYIARSLSGGLLDEKSKKAIASALFKG